MILPLLKAHTQASHDRVEARVPILDDPLPRAQYTGILKVMHAFYVPLEVELAKHALPSGFDFERRRKAHLLDRDLEVLRLHPLPPAPPASLPSLEGVPHALGCLYVLEGATLGGQIIRRHLERQLRLDHETGAAFFTSYGEHVGPMWKKFGVALTEYAARTHSEPAILEGAARTFHALEGWLERHEVVHD